MAGEGGFGGYGGASRGGNPPPASAASSAPAPSPAEVDTTLPLVLSIGSTLLCCDPILGVPAIVLAIQARNAANQGALDIARKRARAALILASIAIALGLLLEAFEGLRYFTTFAATVH
jgi:hypothetical protein